MKQFYKKWWFWLIIIIILIVGIGGSNSNVNNATQQEKNIVKEETKIIDKTEQIMTDIHNVGFNNSALNIILNSIPNVKEKYEKLEQHGGMVWYLYTSDNKYFLIKDSVNNLARISTTEKEVEKRVIYYDKKY